MLKELAYHKIYTQTNHLCLSEPQDQALPTMTDHATTNQLNTQTITNHKCKPNSNQVSDHQASKWPKSPLVNEPCAPIYLTQVQVWSSCETRDSGFDPQWSRQFVDPPPIHRPMWLAIKNMWRKSIFQVLENPSLMRNSFFLELPLTFYFYFWNGEN